MISVVVPTCDRTLELSRCLERLAPGAQQGFALGDSGPQGYEVIVTVDGPQDERLGRAFPWALWTAGPRLGPAANRNHGARQARGEWLAFVDDDCLPDPGWLAAFARAIASQPSCTVFEGRVYADRPRRTLAEEAPLNERGGKLWSCNIALRSDTFVELAGFCEDYPEPAMEDVDLQLRVHEADLHVGFVPAAAVCHPWRPIEWVRLVRQRQARLIFHARHPETLASGWALVAECLRYPLRSLVHTLVVARSVNGRGLTVGLLVPLAEARYWSALLWRSRLGTSRRFLAAGRGRAER